MKELYPGDQGIWVQYLQLALQRAGQQVMLDFDLAALYQVETKVLKQAVRRNIERFPEDFMFEISNEEYNSLKDSLRSQIVTSNKGGIRYMPFAFTEMGVAMLSSVLRSGSAIQVNIAIMRAFCSAQKESTNAPNSTPVTYPGTM